MKKKEKLNLAQWGSFHIDISIHKCPKCDGFLENLNALGVIYLGVCKKCRKFYGIVIEDVTSKLNPKFKRDNLPTNPKTNEQRTTA
jgi:hypothetical protein